MYSQPGSNLLLDSLMFKIVQNIILSNTILRLFSQMIAFVSYSHICTWPTLATQCKRWPSDKANQICENNL